MRRENRQICAAVLFLSCLLAALCGCAAPARSREFFAMDTVMTITASGAEAALDAAEAEVYRLDSLLSAQNETSELAAVNRGSGSVSAETAALISEALTIAQETDGAYDPTVYPLMRAWGFAGGDYRVPEQAELEALLQTTGWEAVSVDGTDVSLPEGFALDLGGIGKGCAAGRCKEILKEYGVTSALLNLGGNVSALGCKPDGSAWTVAIADPDGGAYLGTVQVADQCVVTSGGYQRYFEQDGSVYWHILDPATGKPARSGMRSVTVVSADDTLADALSTALFVMGPERAADFWRAHRAEFGAVWLTEDGRLFVTEGLTLTTELEYEVVS